MRRAEVYNKEVYADLICETAGGTYTFQYAPEYLQNKNSRPVSLTLPLREEDYKSSTMFPFFDGLIPEGWLLDLAVRNWKLTLNGKKAKFKHGDFMACGKSMGIPLKVLERVLTRQIKNKEAMFALIKMSFLTEDLKKALRALIVQNLKIISP